jgi:hypothetical protein
MPHFPTIPMFDERMCMWGKLMPKRGQTKFPITLMSRELFDVLSSMYDLVLDIVEYLYTRMDWRSMYKHIIYNGGANK